MEIKDAIKSMKNIIEYWTYKPSEVEAAKLAIEALENQLSDKWVSMSERLPREHGWYLVTRENGTVDLGHWFFNMGWKDRYNSKVVAWKLLPKPYQAN